MMTAHDFHSATEFECLRSPMIAGIESSQESITTGQSPNPHFPGK